MDSEQVLILDPGDEQAQKIGKAMGSQTAGEILEAFAGGPMTLTALSESLDLPLNTVKYHVQNLLDADLLEIADTRYSVKGRKVNVYALKNRVVIVAPKTADVRGLILKYASLFAVAVAASMGIFIVHPLLSGIDPVDSGPLTAPPPPAGAPAPAPLVPGPGELLPGLAAAFLAGCCLLILALALYEWYGRRG